MIKDGMDQGLVEASTDANRNRSSLIYEYTYYLYNYIAVV